MCSQVTTESHILSSDEVDELIKCLQQTICSVEVHAFLLQEFDTELDFTSKIRYYYIQCSARERNSGSFPM